MVVLKVRQPAPRPLRAAYGNPIPQLLHLTHRSAHRLHLGPERTIVSNLGQKLKGGTELVKIRENVPPPAAISLRNPIAAAAAPHIPTNKLAGLSGGNGSEAHHLAKQVEDAVHVVVLGQRNGGRDGRFHGFRAQQRLGAEVVGEDEGLDELLEAAEGIGVSVAVEGDEVGFDGAQVVLDFGHAAVNVFLGALGEGAKLVYS